MNNVKLMGRLGRDPEQKEFNTGGSIVTFTLATDDSYTDRNGQRQPRVEWHRIVVGNPRLGENCMQYLRKGQRALVDGYIHYRHWTGPDGKEIYSTEIRAFRIDFIDRRSGDGAAQDMLQEPNAGADAQQPQAAQRPAVQPEEDYGIPAGGDSDVPF